MGKYALVLILAFGLFCTHKVNATPAPGDFHAGVQTGGVDVVNIYISNVKACAIDWAQEPRFPSVVLSENSVSVSQAGKRVSNRVHSTINQVDLHYFGRIYGGPVCGVYVVNPSADTMGRLMFAFDFNRDKRIYVRNGVRRFGFSFKLLNV